MSNLYSARANERRRQFNNIINGIDMVLMNNIVDVDPDIWENWEGNDPMGNDECDIELTEDESGYVCNTHGVDIPYSEEEPDQCDEYEEDAEVYQWFAVSDNDADFLKRHGQYVTYSDLLDTYFLAITHFGTSWDYTSMVDDFESLYHGLDKLDDEKETV